MAWEEFEQDGIKGMTGDKPIDRFALALGDIAKAYEADLERKPTLAELLRAFETVLRAHPERYVSDTEGLSFGAVSVSRDVERARKHIDSGKYEGAFVDEPPPGSYLVQERADPQTEVIRVPTLEVQERTLEAPYEILADGLSDEQAQKLIQDALLGYFMNHYYDGQVDQIAFHNLKSDARATVPYAPSA